MEAAKGRVRALCAAPGVKGTGPALGVRAPRGEDQCVHDVAAALEEALVDCRVRVALVVPGEHTRTHSMRGGGVVGVLLEERLESGAWHDEM